MAVSIVKKPKFSADSDPHLREIREILDREEPGYKS